MPEGDDIEFQPGNLSQPPATSPLLQTGVEGINRRARQIFERPFVLSSAGDESSEVSRCVSRYPALPRLPSAPRILKPGPALVALCAVELSPADDSVQTESSVYVAAVQCVFKTRRAPVDQSWQALYLAVRIATLSAVLWTPVAGPIVFVVTHRACYVLMI